MGDGLKVLSHLKGTTDEKIDAIARDVNVELNQGVNNLDAKADKLVKDVQAETAEMRKIIESAEFGIPAPSLASMTAVSDEAGINVTVTATDATVDYSSDKAVLATTKGVMVRYKDGSYPTNKEDGELAFIDDDLFTVDTDGNRVAKAKTHLVVGLTKDHVYFFSAFPYTQQGAHNERLGTGNVAKCRWVGNAATLTVNIAKDYDIFDLGEVTVTLRNDSTSETHTQKRTGVGNVVFSGIAAGNYTVSFAGANADCSNPDSQSVTLVGGASKIISGVFAAKVGNLERASWDAIAKVSEAGIASRFFSVGDTKTVSINGEETVFEIADFNHDRLSGGGRAGITFLTKFVDGSSREWNGVSSTNDYEWWESGAFMKVLPNLKTQMPQDLQNVIKRVVKETSYRISGSKKEDIVELFVPSETEVGLSQYSWGGEGYTYPIFTTDETRKKAPNSGSPFFWEWVLRSPTKEQGGSKINPVFCQVTTSGSAGETYGIKGSTIYFVYGFCI